MRNEDMARLANLYTSSPENQEQLDRRAKLIYELELKLGIIKVESNAMVEHGELDDLEGYGKKK